MTVDIPGSPFPEMVFDLSKFVIDRHDYSNFTLLVYMTNSAGESQHYEVDE